MQGSKLKKKMEVAFQRLNEKDKSLEVIGAPKAGKSIKKFPLTLTARQLQK